MENESMRPASVGFFADLDASRARAFMKEKGLSLQDTDGLANADSVVRRQTFPTLGGPSDSGAEAGLATYDAGSLGAVRTGPGRAAAQSNQLQDKVLWLQLGLCKALVRAVTTLGYFSPTPVQVAAIPDALQGRDLCVRAVTGSGKTAAFLLPLLNTLLTKPPKKQTHFNTKRKYIRSLVLVPSRELGVQCETMARQLMQHTSELTVSLAIGGVAARAQEAALDQAPDIVIATPGRLCDIVHNYKTEPKRLAMPGKKISNKQPKSAIDLSGVEFVVLDECDKMLTALMKDQVKDLLDRTDETLRQMVLVSATMTKDVDDFAKEHLFKPKNVDVGHVGLATQLRQQFVRIKTDMADIDDEDRGEDAGPARKHRKGRHPFKRDEDFDSDEADDEDEIIERFGGKHGKRRRPKKPVEEEESHATVDRHISKIKTRYLVALCQCTFKGAVLVFTKFRSTAHRLYLLFNQLDMPAAELQGNQPQQERLDALRMFSEGRTKFLFCTDVASRGLDIIGVSTVINFDMPQNLTTYIHRVGRTARIGDSGTAVSLVHEVADADIMRKILTVSAHVSTHQIASVKRRDIPEEQLERATEAINRVFPVVRTIIAAEALESRIDAAEKRATNNEARLAAIADNVVARPQKTWTLTRAEKRRREEEERAKFKAEADNITEETRNELALLASQENKFLMKQKRDRRAEREKKERAHERELAQEKRKGKKERDRMKAGVVKQLKKKKLREARKAERAANREKRGGKPYVRKVKKAAKKSRHAKRMKRH